MQMVICCIALPLLKTCVYLCEFFCAEVGAFGGIEECMSFAEMSDMSGSLGSTYFDCESIELAEQMISTPSVFSSSRDLCLSDRSPGVASLDSPLELSHSPAMARSPDVRSIGRPHSTSPSLSPDYGSVVTPAGPHLSALPPPDDAFWNSSEFNYGSLPTRSRKRSFLSNRSYSTAQDQGTRSLAFRHRIDHILVNSTLFEEGDESQEVRNVVEKKSENKKNLSAFGPKLSPADYPSPTDSTAAKTLSKISASVPNLIKLKGIGSPFLPRRSKNSFLRSNSKVKEEAGDLHVGRDPRVMTKQMREQISNYVMTEDLCRKHDDPQLLGLKQLCNDFRDSCFQHNLKQRRKSIELMNKRTSAIRPPTLDLKSSDAHYQKPEFQASKDLVGVESMSTDTNSKELAKPLPDCSQPPSKTALKSVKRCETADAHRPPLSKAVGDQQGSSHDDDMTLGACNKQIRSAMESGVGLHESHDTCDIPDGFTTPVSGSASSYLSSVGRCSMPCVNADDEVTRL